MTPKDRVVTVYVGDETTLPAPGAVTGALPYPTAQTVKASSAGALLAASPAVSAASLVVSITRNSAGDYTVLLHDQGQTAAQVGPRVSSNTSGIRADAVVTDATHIEVHGTDAAAAATDCAFTLAVDLLHVA